MAQPYVGEIRMFAGNFAPAGWAFCDGSLVPISENDTLFQLIGTTYGGDGQNTFALPDLRGRLPIHQGNGFLIGQPGGVEEVTLTVPQIPSHSHPYVASQNIAPVQPPGNSVVAQSTLAKMYIQDVADQAMAQTSIQPTGGSQPHTNFQPYLCVNFIISLFGIFPTQT
jgi:microcystin-dependent protein